MMVNSLKDLKGGVHKLTARHFAWCCKYQIAVNLGDEFGAQFAVEHLTKIGRQLAANGITVQAIPNWPEELVN